jgi:hypothetical protein
MSEDNSRRRFGDRSDGRRLRSYPALNQMTPYLMVQRNDAFVLFSGEIEVTETDRWLREKRAEGYKGIGMLHMFLASYVRTVSQLPSLNRFVSGRRVYARNCIEVVMMVKRGLTADAEETDVKVRFAPTDTIFDIYNKMNAAVDEVRAESEGNDTEKISNVLTKLPRFLLRFAMSILRFLDYNGWMPRYILDASPFHGSLIVTDLGSLGIGPVYHHIYNFGNLPMFLAFGAKRHVVELDRHGTPVEHKYVDYKVTCDERISDGFSFASAFKYLKYYVKNPRELEVPPEKVVEDIF